LSKCLFYFLHPNYLFMDKNDFQPISEIGFPKLIEKFEKYKGAEIQNVVKGIGDDSSVFKTDGGKLNLLSSTLI